MLRILATHPDRSRVIHVIQGWIWYYRSCLSRKRVNPQDPYGDLFGVDLDAVAVALKRQSEVDENELIRDTRWAGATWSNSDGLWGPLLRTSTTICDKLDESDLAPGIP